MYQRFQKLTATSTRTQETRASCGANGHLGPNGPAVQGAAAVGFHDSRGAVGGNRAKAGRGARNTRSATLSPARTRTISGRSNVPCLTTCHIVDNC